MRKKIWARLIERPTLTIVLVVAAMILVIAVVSHWSAVISLANSLLGWATDKEFYILISTVLFFYIGSCIKMIGASERHEDFIKNTFWYKASLPISKFAFNISRNNFAHLNRMALKKIGYFWTWCSVVLFILNLFPFFNYWGILKVFIIFLGFVALLAIAILILAALTKIIKNSLFFNVIFGFLLLILVYYLDFFIFAWNKPWICCVVILILIFILTTRYAKRWLKEMAEQKRERKRKENLRLEAENTERIIQEIAKLSMCQILLKYLELKKSKSEQKPAEQKSADQKLAALHLKAYPISRKRQPGISQAEMKKVLKKISFINFGIDAEFYQFILQELSLDDSEIILLTNTANPLGEDDLPVLFRYYQNKKAVLRVIPNIKKDVFYNELKKEFKIKEFVGLVNAITYSYLKEWDDKEWLQTTIDTLESLIKFAVECTEKVWSIDEAIKITSALENLETNYQRKGVQVTFPESFKLAKEKFSI